MSQYTVRYLDARRGADVSPAIERVTNGDAGDEPGQDDEHRVG